VNRFIYSIIHCTKVAVHSPFEEPQMLKDGVGTPALHEVFIKVKGELRIVDKELRDMPKVRFV